MYPNKIAVASRTFSNTPELRNNLLEHFLGVKFNQDNKFSGKELADFIGDAEGAIIALEEVNEEVLDRCPSLKIISKFGVGLDNIDLNKCKERDIKVGWTPGTNRLSVAEVTLAFMLALSRNLFKTALELRKGVWNKNGGRDLSGRTVGIIGVGRVGKELVRLLKPFHCQIMVNDIVDQKEYYGKEGLIEATKEEIFSRAEILSLHVPLTDLTWHMVDDSVLATMRSDAYIVNTSRGHVVDLAALKDALIQGQIAGAALDVYNEEPPEDKELIALENLISTPHIGGNSKEAVVAMGMSAIEHLKNYFEN